MKTTRIFLVLASALLLLGSSAARAADEPTVLQLIRQSQDAAAANRLEDAEARARDAVAKDAAFADAWKQLGQVLQQRGRNGEAASAFQQAVDLKPGDAAAWRDLGWALWADGRRKDAVDALDKAIRENVPNRDDVILQVVAALSEADDGRRAVELYRTWRPGEPMLKAARELAAKGRLTAATPLFRAAWDQDEDKERAGLYLAYAEALNGNCAAAGKHLKPFLAADIGKADPSEIDMLLECLDACPDLPNAAHIAEQAAAAGGGASNRAAVVTDIIERAADEARVAHDDEQALKLYRRALSRDPNRESWVHAVDLAAAVEGAPAAEALLTNLLAGATDAGIRAGIEGKRAEQAGDFEKAAALYRESLEALPKQAEIRYALFQSLLRVGDVDKARIEANWFRRRVDDGETAYRPHLAEMLMALGEMDEAVSVWQALHEASPSQPYYGIGLATALFRLCRPDEAVAVLEGMLKIAPSTSVYELLCEIESARGNSQKVAEFAAAGIGIRPTPALLRYRAESAEAMTDSQTALTAANDFLATDPGYVPMALTAGRSLMALGRTNEARLHYEGLLARNPSFLSALVNLRDIATHDARYGDAVTYAKAAAETRPWDVEARQRYAVSLGEYDRFYRSIRILRRAAGWEPSEAVPILVYRQVTDCDYPGRTTAKQVLSHIRYLSGKGYELVTPADLAKKGTGPRVIVCIAGADPRSLEKLDTALTEAGGRAVYAASAAELNGAVPGRPSPARIEGLRHTGRWVLASAGPEDNSRKPVAEKGILGNPLTHRLDGPDGSPEEEADFEARLDEVMAESAAAIGDEGQRILFYPAGDYGQLSLDSTAEEQAALRKAVGRQFTHAVAADDGGFAAPGHDALRLPGRNVPASWTAEDLARHLQTANPVVRAKLNLAKMYYWSRQHELANRWFKKALEAGADPKEVVFNQGANLYQLGDLAASSDYLRKAAALQPGAPKVEHALDRVENRRRPTVALEAAGWFDNEDRTSFKAGGQGQAFVGEKVQLRAFANRNRWETESIGVERGTRAGAGAMVYLFEQMWIDGELWWLAMDNLEDELGGSASLHVPNPLLSGNVELQASRDEVDSVEALRADIYQDTYALRTYSRFFDKLDLYANLSAIDRTDGNLTRMLDGRLVGRLNEWPFIGAGYLFRFADSDFDPPEYWAPEELEQHQLYANVRGLLGPVNYAVSGQAGYSRERDGDWEFVWGGRGRLEYGITRRLSISGEASYFEGPVYERTTWTAGITGRF